MGDRLGETIRNTISGPVIIGAASFWYSITGWEESLLMRDGIVHQTCVLDLRQGEVIIKVSVHSVPV